MSSTGDTIHHSMSLEEDFSLVLPNQQPSEDSLEGIKALTAKFKKQHQQLLQDHKELATNRDQLKVSAKQFEERSKKLTQSRQINEDSYKEQLQSDKAQLTSLKAEQVDLMKDIENVKAALLEEEAKYDHLKQQTDVFSAVPERNLVFTGKMGMETQFEMQPHIVYPMDEGTALITFEEEEVARDVLDKMKHQVIMAGECSITLEARPVPLMLPRLVEIESEVCQRSILVSNLPKMETDPLLNKLEIHFSKTRHGGGEVDRREYLPDSKTVVITFLKPDFAKGLTNTEFHDVEIHDQKFHKVRVTPFLNGNITNFKTKMSVCPRTVLLTGIPAIMDQESMQDTLEIHFQKSCHGGGEIEAFLYNPMGQRTSALFKGAPAKEEEEEE